MVRGDAANNEASRWSKVRPGSRCAVLQGRCVGPVDIPRLQHGPRVECRPGVEGVLNFKTCFRLAEFDATRLRHPCACGQEKGNWSCELGYRHHRPQGYVDNNPLEGARFRPKGRLSSFVLRVTICGQSGLAQCSLIGNTALGQHNNMTGDCLSDRLAWEACKGMHGAVASLSHGKQTFRIKVQRSREVMNNMGHGDCPRGWHSLTGSSAGDWHERASCKRRRPSSRFAGSCGP